MATLNGEGAGVITTYFDTEQQVVGVTTETLEDIRDSGFEEFLQFAIAEFFVAGALWLAVEKGIESFEKNIPLSPIFWICIAAIVMGLCVAFSGFRQMKRRKSKIDKIIDKARSIDQTEG